jgi:hypothetical protein
MNMLPRFSATTVSPSLTRYVFLVTDFINLKIKSDQFFYGFIRVGCVYVYSLNDSMCKNLRVCTIFLKKTS